jgi:chromosome segregation ATPase
MTLTPPKKSGKSPRTLPRPSPRYTRRDLDSKFYSQAPDPEGRIEDIREQAACLEAENTRIDSKNVRLVIENRNLAQSYNDLCAEQESLDRNIEMADQEVSQRNLAVATLAAQVEETTTACENLKKTLLRQQQYAQLQKEFRQLKAKRHSTVKKLQIVHAQCNQTDLSNPTEAISSLQEEIAILRDNIVSLQEQIGSVKAQIDDALKTRERGSSLLTPLRSRRSSIADSPTELQIEFSRSPIASRLSESCADDSLLTAIDAEIVTKSRTRDELRRIAASSPRSPPQISRALSTNGILQGESFSVVPRKVSKYVSEDNTLDRDLETLRSEFELITAKLAAEEQTMAREASEQTEIAARRKVIEDEIEEKRRVSSQIERETIVLQSDVSRRISQRSAALRSLDELLASSKPEMQELMRDLHQYRIKYEEDAHALRLAEIELSEIKSVVAEQGSETEEDFGILISVKSGLERDLAKLSAELRGGPAIVEDPQAEKDRLLKDVERVRKQVAADEQEVRQLEQYSDQLNEFLNDARRKRSK